MLEKFTRDIAIDFGTASVLVYVQGQGIVLKEPSVVAIDVSTDRVVKVGQDAMEMLGRTPDHIDALRPMKNGTISQYEVTLQMLRYFIRRACGKVWIPPDSFKKEKQPANTLSLAHRDKFWTSALQNCKMLNFCCVT